MPADAGPKTYTCGLCGKGYRSTQTHAQHLNSRRHVLLASQLALGGDGGSCVIIKPLKRHVVEKKAVVEDYSLDPSSCFMCDQEHPDIESCMVHMHKYHGLFIPDVEYLEDPSGLLTYLGLKVKRDFTCLYCNYRCHPFLSLEAVRMHMEAKSHCKVHYGDGSEDEEAELEEFYDYSSRKSSYVDEAGKQLVVSGDMTRNVELGTAGFELVITNRSGRKTYTKTLGCRQFLRYYRQKPRPSANNMAIINVIASRYKGMRLATVQSKEQLVKMKLLKKINQSGVEAMRNKICMKR